MSLENANAMTILSEGPVEADPISADASYITLHVVNQIHKSAQAASGRIVLNLWIIFVLLPIVLGILFMIVK
jgi:hypothetical protein